MVGALVAVALPSSVLGATAELLIAPTGEAADDHFGISVGTAGDVNGDGYADVVVGAHLNDAAGVDAGRAYVYYGGPSADPTPDLILTGDSAGANFGRCVDTAGDVNGDGYADVVVGADFNSVPWTDAGRAYIFFGGPLADATADLTLTGEMVGDRFGFRVGTAGDVNGDGYDDVIVGAVDSDAADTDAGRAYVFYGGPSPDAMADLILTGEAAGDQLGFSVGTAGDVNGDGYADVIVGARFNDAGGPDAGRAYVYYGGLSPDATADWTLTGEAANDEFGRTAGTAGDVNGDGWDDVVVGAYGNDTAGSEAGRAYVFHGGPSADAAADMVLTGEAAGDRFGISVGTAGDVNGDGFDDLVVCAPRSDAGGLDAGRAYVFHGGPSADTTADVVLAGAAAGDTFGNSAGTAGDVNGDGFDDVVVGASQNDVSGIDSGRAYVHSIFPYRILSPNGGEQWVAGQPAVVRWKGQDPADLELSTDGGLTYTLLVSGVGGGLENQHTVLAPTVPTRAARIRLKYQGEAPTRSNSEASDAVFRIVEPVTPPAVACRLLLTLDGEAASDFFGGSVSTAGDVNGDGFDDVIVGARANDAGGAEAGRAYVYHGGPSTSTTPDLILTGEAAEDFFGVSVATAGDVNGDGFSDVVVGAYHNSAGGSWAGRAYVYYGGVAADSTADLTLTGEAANDVFGSSVGTAGDVNGDGFDDVIVGALGNDAGGGNAGRAYVYYGGPTADTTPDLTLTGEAAEDNFGESVATAGDVNGDGFDDVVVGAYGNDAGGTAAGRAYIYFGGPSVDDTPDLVLTGEAVADKFGQSVGTAGDVNGDGFDDVVVGANGSNAGATDAGRAYVYHGGPSADERPDLIFTGESAYDYFGFPVGTAGDVNDDGFSDLVIGAYGAERAFVYFGGPAADARADLVFSEEGGSSEFGAAAGTAGDANGDGFDDVVVGARFGNVTGRAYVYDCARYFVTSPSGGDTWNVGATEVVTWLGAEPADVSLSVNGGAEFFNLATSVGGGESNALPLVVPHTPTHFACVRVSPSRASLHGRDQSDSLFTIDATITLLSFHASFREGSETQAVIAWRTDPEPGDLAAYRLERADGGSGWRTLVETQETEHLDEGATGGSRYRLTAINGLRKEYVLGETTLGMSAPLAAWPLPYRGGELRITFGTASGLGGGPSPAEVILYDVTGRKVRTIVRGEFVAGYQRVVWNGRDENGLPVASGVYFLHVNTPGNVRSQKLAVLR